MVRSPLGLWARGTRVSAPVADPGVGWGADPLPFRGERVALGVVLYDYVQHPLKTAVIGFRFVSLRMALSARYNWRRPEHAELSLRPRDTRLADTVRLLHQ